MDRDRRLDAVRDLPAEGRAGHRRRRAACRTPVLGRASEHDRLVRAHSGEITMTLRRAFLGCILVASATAAPAAAPASMAARGHRAATVGIDVVTYPTHVRDVVVVLG